MALPSQSGARGGGGRRKNGPPVVPIVFGMLVVGGGAYGAYVLWGGQQSPGTDAETAGASESVPASNEGASEPPARVVENVPPPVIDTGGTESDPVADAGSVDEDFEPVVGDTSQIASRYSIENAAAPVQDLLRQAATQTRDGDMVGARQTLTSVLVHPAATGEDREMARADLEALNDELIFGRRVYEGDPVAYQYEIGAGDTLERITAREGLAVDWRLIQRINGIADVRRIQFGQKVKLVRGPFHGMVHKDDFRMDVYVGPPDSPQDWLFVRSFPVGLGEGDSTPIGTYVVKENSKLIDPYWVNPRTGEPFKPEDPDNPIGERWIGLAGVGEYAVNTGYGIHGTIDPDSIGKQMSMGCVRLGDEDVELVYELFEEQVSVVEILD